MTVRKRINHMRRFVVLLAMLMVFATLTGPRAVLACPA
jgi:hypothetical protein